MLCIVYLLYYVNKHQEKKNKFPRQLKTPYTKCETLIIILHMIDLIEMYTLTHHFIQFSRGAYPRTKRKCAKY